jgi:hypothetical protein
MSGCLVGGNGIGILDISGFLAGGLVSADGVTGMIDMSGCLVGGKGIGMIDISGFLTGDIAFCTNPLFGFRSSIAMSSSPLESDTKFDTGLVPIITDFVGLDAGA